VQGVFDSRHQKEDALNRLILSDDQWERAAPHLPGKVGDPGRSEADNRKFREAVL
jgi:hypothetical protein